MRANNIFIYHLDYEIQKLFNLNKSYNFGTIYSCFNTITRLAYLICSDSILIPASNYFESDLAFSIINNLKELNEIGCVKLLSSSYNLDELLSKKLIQHEDNIENPQYHYKDFLKQDETKIYLPGTLVKRKGSASNDIKNDWVHSIGSEVLWKDLFELAPDGTKVSSFENKLYSIPEKLGNKAYISKYITPLLNVDIGSFNKADNLINVFITKKYIESFLKEYDAACIKDVPLFDASLILPNEVSGYKRLHISYRYYAEKLKILKYKNVQALNFINNCSAYELIEFKNSNEWRSITNLDLYNINELMANGKETFKSMEIIDNSKTALGTNKLNTKDVKIGIITALAKECAAMKVLMNNVEECFFEGKGAGHRYYIGEIKSANNKIHKIALCLCGMGNNNASVRATNMLTHFTNIESIIMTGIAGGIPSIGQEVENDIRLGDIVVSNSILQYDFIKDTSEKITCRSEPPLPSAQLLEAVESLKILEFENEYKWREYIDESMVKLNFHRPSCDMDVLHDKDGNVVVRNNDNERSGYPKVFYSKIASANTLLKNAKKRNDLKKLYGVCAVEMEASGIADATWNNQCGYMVIRGICDYCDDYKNDIWQNYASIAAAAYTRSLIEALPIF